MSFKREKIVNYYLHDTNVENVFISEYMVNAPGDYVKVYLFALMHAEIRLPLTNRRIAEQLSLGIEDVLKAWTYWEEFGVVKKHYAADGDEFDYEVEFLDLKELLYGKGEKKAESKGGSALVDKDVQEMFRRIEQLAGRPLTGKEPVTISSWLDTYGVAPAYVAGVYEYCVKTAKNDSASYVGKVIHEWVAKGVRTPEAIKAHVEETDNRHYMYKRIFKALGFLRYPTESEKAIMDVWFDEWRFDLNRVLEACGKSSGVSNPSINYVNGVLKNWKDGTGKGEGAAASAGSHASPSNTVIQRVIASYEEERKEEEMAAGARREEIFNAIPRIREIEDEIRAKGMEMSKCMLSGSRRDNVRMLRDEIEHLSAEKAYLLTEKNYPVNYMDLRYKCQNCKDTGVLDNGDRCPCFAAKMKEFAK